MAQKETRLINTHILIPLLIHYIRFIVIYLHVDGYIKACGNTVYIIVVFIPDSTKSEHIIYLVLLHFLLHHSNRNACLYRQLYKIFTGHGSDASNAAYK